ncbi:MAG: hypothetical protein AB1564_14910 [Chloroflexota bacterium]
MAEISVTIIDHRGRQSEQHLNNAVAARQVISSLVERLDLPKDLDYELVPAVADASPIPAHLTLTQAGITPGMELLLRAERNEKLTGYLEKLYDEVLDHVKDRLWDMARAKLEELFKLDPAHADPLNLKDTVLGGIPPGTPQPTPPPQQQMGQQLAKPSKGCSPGCVIGAVVAAGAVVLLAGGGIFLLWYLFSSTPTPDVVLGTGDVQVTLRWEGPADLDLHVYDPYGEEIWFEHPTSSSGGILDVDANAGCQGIVANPVENAFWPTGGAPTGPYRVAVHYFTACAGSGPTDFEVTVKVDGRVVGVYTGTVYETDDFQEVTTFRR